VSIDEKIRTFNIEKLAKDLEAKTEELNWRIKEGKQPILYTY
jgi:hypothetical protein